MTRTTNARIAGFTYLFYAAIGICGDLLMHHAFGGADDATTLARFGEYATEVRIDILIKLLEALSALVLAVTLYGITRDEDHELAMLGMVCRVAEGVLGTLSIQSYLGLVWLAKAGAGPGSLDLSTTNALRTFLLMPVPSVPVGTVFFAVGSTILSYLLLRGRMVPVWIAWLSLFASGAARGGTAPASRRFLHVEVDRVLPMAAGPRCTNRACAVAADQRRGHARWR